MKFKKKSYKIKLFNTKYNLEKYEKKTSVKSFLRPKKELL